MDIVVGYTTYGEKANCLLRTQGLEDINLSEEKGEQTREKKRNKRKKAIDTNLEHGVGPA
jgi:hypothetical protein